MVGAFYYLTIIKVMYFDEPAGEIEPMRIELRTVLAVAGIFNIFFFVYPGPLVSVATAAAKSLFQDDLRARSHEPYRRATVSPPSTRSVRPMPKPWRAPAMASAARCGS